MHDIYKDFLTEEEFQEVIVGREIWFDAEEIVARLKRRAELQEAAAKAEEESQVQALLKQEEAIEAEIAQLQAEQKPKVRSRTKKSK
jgi:hypothetical protein